MNAAEALTIYANVMGYLFNRDRNKAFELNDIKFYSPLFGDMHFKALTMTKDGKSEITMSCQKYENVKFTEDGKYVFEDGQVSLNPMLLPKASEWSAFIHNDVLSKLITDDKLKVITITPYENNDDFVVPDDAITGSNWWYIDGELTKNTDSDKAFFKYLPEHLTKPGIDWLYVEDNHGIPHKDTSLKPHPYINGFYRVLCGVGKVCEGFFWTDDEHTIINEEDNQEYQFWKQRGLVVQYDDFNAINNALDKFREKPAFL
ncbi:MAG: hypothetical protein MJ237_05940 [bacterium]|nr:hypothetical protein [bacterium]